MRTILRSRARDDVKSLKNSHFFRHYRPEDFSQEKQSSIICFDLTSKLSCTTRSLTNLDRTHSTTTNNDTISDFTTKLEVDRLKELLMIHEQMTKFSSNHAKISPSEALTHIKILTRLGVVLKIKLSLKMIAGRKFVMIR